MSPRRLLPVLVAALGLLLFSLTPVAGAAPAAHAHKGKAAKAKKAKAKKARKARKAKRSRAIDPQLPKAWAKRYGVRKAAGDPDRDGLRNAAEAKAGLNPKKADTDGDGVRDGDEHPGVVLSVSSTGATIKLFAGGTLTASFGPDTELLCSQEDLDAAAEQQADDYVDAMDDADAADARAEQSGDDDTAGEDPGDDEDVAGDDDGDDAADEDDAPAATCDGAAPGDRVYEATVTGGVFDTFDLVGP